MKKEILLDGKMVEVDILEQTAEEVSFVLQGKTFRFLLSGKFEGRYVVKNKETEVQSLIWAKKWGEQILLNLRGRDALVKLKLRTSAAGGAADEGSAYLSPMPGKVFRLMAKEGEQVKAGQVLMILEAMKMEHSIKAKSDGLLEKIYFKEGALVEGGVELVKVAPAAKAKGA